MALDMDDDMRPGNALGLGPGESAQRARRAVGGDMGSATGLGVSLPASAATRLFVGIDPGKSGAVVVLSPSAHVLAHSRLPILGRGSRERVDIAALTAIVDSVVAPSGLLDSHVLVAIERVHSMPTDGNASAFTFGKAVGAVFGWAEARGYAIAEVMARDWQGAMLRGYPRGSRAEIKASATLVASDLWPILREPLRAKNNQGIADAALIAACVLGRFSQQPSGSP